MKDELEVEDTLDYDEVENIVNAMLADVDVVAALRKLKINHKDAIADMRNNLDENGLLQGDEETLREACTRYIQTYILDAVNEKYIQDVFEPVDSAEDITIDEDERNAFLGKYEQYLEDGEYNNLKKLILQDPKSIAFLLEEPTFESLTPEEQAELRKYILSRMKVFNEALKNVAIDKNAYEGQVLEENENENEIEISEPTKSDNFVEFETGEKFNESEETEEISELPKEEQKDKEVTKEDDDDERTDEPELKDMQNSEEYSMSEEEMARHYSLYKVNEAYLEMHPDLREATFVEATGGTDLEKFAKTILALQKQSETKIIAVFNQISIDVSECNDIGEIIETFNENREKENENAKAGVIREKGEFLNEGLYNSQFYRSPSNEHSLIEQFRRDSHYHKDFDEHGFHHVLQMKENCPDISKFLEAAMYYTQDTTGNTYIEINGVILCANEFKSQEELAQKVDEINKVQRYNSEIEKHPEKYPGKEKKDIFIHSKSYYQSLVVVDKKATDAQIEVTGNSKVKVLRANHDINLNEFSEAARYFGARNPDIYMETSSGEIFRPSEYTTIDAQENERKESLTTNPRIDRSTIKQYMDRTDFSEEQLERWQLQPQATIEGLYEHPEDGILQHLKLNIGVPISKEDIIADIIDFKSKGYDIGFECVGGFIDTRMSKTPEEIKALVEDTFMKGQQKTAREESTRRLEEVFSEPNIGTDTAEIDAVLKALLEPTISQLKNVSESMQTHERMREGILPEQTQNENSELEQDEEYESHIPSFPTERD